MFTIGLNSDVLAGMAGVLISLGCSYLPGVSARWDALEGVWKRLTMAIMLMVVSVVIVALSCAGVLQGVECSQKGAWAVLSALFSALTANQSTYALAGKKSDKMAVRVIGEVS